jgi:hypothetical protein
MALSFPLNLSDFLETFKIAGLTIRLGEALIVNRTGGGELIRSDYGSRLWEGSITIASQRNATIEDVMSLVYRLQDGNGSFMIHPIHKQGPAALSALGEWFLLRGVVNARGIWIDSETAQINSLPVNARTITLKGLDPGFVITRGDFLSFTYLSSPTRHAFHQAVESVAANSSGVTGPFEVMPPIRPGAAVDAVVRLHRPQLKAIMVPGSLRQSGMSPESAASISFEWRQTLR